MFMPVIEIQDGKAVNRTADGRPQPLKEDPLELARRLYRYGELAVIDLDGAREEGDNTEIILQICREADCCVGGGITDFQKADLILRGGARQLIVGSAVNRLVIERFPRQRILLALDNRPDPSGLEEWRVPEDSDAVNTAAALERVVSGFVYGFGNADMENFRALQGRTDRPILAMGGFGTAKDVLALDRSDVDCLLSPSAVEPLELEELVADLLDFENTNRLIPTIVQDTARQVLGLFVSNHQAVVQTLKTGNLTFWRSPRGDVVAKETSTGDKYPLVTVRVDPRRRVLLYTVVAKGAIDPSGNYSYFGEKTFSLETLEDVLKSRLKKPPSSSYTQQILASPEGVVDQIVHQAKELAQASEQRQVVWETADLIYYLLVNLIRQDVPLASVFNELRGRAGRRK
jgi:phosphoribosyl-ATP pyrophosphohydrolase